MTYRVTVPRHSLWDHPAAIVLTVMAALSLATAVVVPLAVVNIRVSNAEPVVNIPPVVIPSIVPATVAPSATATTTPTVTPQVASTDVVLPDVWNCVMIHNIVPIGGYHEIAVSANTGRLWLVADPVVEVRFSDGKGGWIAEYQIGPEGALVELTVRFGEYGSGGSYIYVMGPTDMLAICFPPAEWIPTP